MIEARKIQVLVVEACSVTQKLLLLELSQIQDPLCEAFAVSSLKEAVLELNERTKDVVLIDLDLSDANGLEAIRVLCAEFPTLAVVALAVLDDQRLGLEALREGAQDFLPRDKAQAGVLRRVVTHAIERKRVDVTLNGARDSLREAQRFELMGRLASKVAHDFNNVLTTIIGYSDLVLEEALEPQLKEDIQEIRRAGQQGVALTARILAFARGENSISAFFCLNTAVRETAGMLGRLMSKKIKISFDLGENLPKLFAVRGHIDQILANLIINAKDALPQGGLVLVSTAYVDDRTATAILSVLPSKLYDGVLRLSVEDNGQGMDEAVLSRVFDPFFTTKPTGSGTGLGLPVIQGIVARQGGQIEICSRLGHGTKVTIYFPILSDTRSFEDVSEEPTVKREEPLDPRLLNIKPLSEAGRHLQLLDRLQSTKSDSSWLEGRDAVRHLGYLYQVVSQDLARPLRLVAGYLDALVQQGCSRLQGELRELLQGAITENRHVYELLETLRRYTRLLGAPALPRPTDVGEVFRQVRLLIPEGERIEWKGPSPTVFVASEHMAILLEELLSNAVNSCLDGDGKIWIECSQTTPFWLVAVHDYGSGLESCGPIQNFPPFRSSFKEEPRGEAGRRMDGGAPVVSTEPMWESTLKGACGRGIGLAIVECLASKYGGYLELANAPRGGCVANLYLPIVLEATVA